MPLKKQFIEDDVLTCARKRVAQVFDQYDIPVVSFSGGKDSTVVLNLALEEMRARKKDGRLPEDFKLIVMHIDEEAIQWETVDYCERVMNLPDVDFRWYCLPVKHVNACSQKSPFWYTWAPEEEHLWCRPMPPWAISTLEGYPIEVEHKSKRKPYSKLMELFFPRTGATIGLMLGVRADESLRRYRSVAHRVKDNWIAFASGAKYIAFCKPIYDWTTLDVWTAPLKFGWDWNRAYDAMTKLGMTPNSQRVAPPFGQQPLRALWTYRECWPELWEKLCVRVPGANTAVRYSNSPLYAFGGPVSRQDGESWESAIVRELNKWKPEQRVILADRIRSEIQRHNRMHPGVPVPETKHHIDLVRGRSSGLTMEFLLKVANRGDIKGRMNPSTVVLSTINDARKKEWGEDWMEKYPHIAAKTVYDPKNQEWLSPDDARKAGVSR